MRHSELGEVFLMLLSIIATIIFLCCLGFWFIKGFDGLASYHVGDYENYKEYKERTVLLEGKVTKAEKESHFISSDDYNLVIKNNKGDSKIVKVDENQYRNYQAGADVKFKIDEKASNEVVVDLNKEKDIKNKKAFKQKFDSDLDHLFSH